MLQEPGACCKSPAHTAAVDPAEPGIERVRAGLARACSTANKEGRLHRGLALSPSVERALPANPALRARRALRVRAQGLRRRGGPRPAVPAARAGGRARRGRGRPDRGGGRAGGARPAGRRPPRQAGAPPGAPARTPSSPRLPRGARLSVHAFFLACCPSVGAFGHCLVLLDEHVYDCLSCLAALIVYMTTSWNTPDQSPSLARTAEHQTAQPLLRTHRP